MKARACFKCWQYVDVNLVDIYNQRLVRRFDIDHKNHGLLLMENSEVKDRYTDVNLLYAEI